MPNGDNAEIIKQNNLAQAKKLWEETYISLENAHNGVDEYFKLIDKFYDFMSKNNITQEEMRAQLTDKTISPQAWAAFSQLQNQFIKYAERLFAELDDKTQAENEAAIVFELDRKSVHFIDSKYEPSREKFDMDENYQLENSTILSGIIQKINAENSKKNNLFQAKKLWEEAYVNLENAHEGIDNYLNSIDKFYDFMSKNNITQEEMRAQLTDKTISPQAWAAFSQIQNQFSEYTRRPPIEQDDKIKSSFVSALGSKSIHFIDSKQAPSREKVDMDENYQLENSKILTSIMQKIDAEIIKQNKLDHAKNLWEEAYVNLENAHEGIDNYLKSIDALYGFMDKNKDITQEEMRIQLKDKTISPKAWAAFSQIQNQFSEYARGSSVELDDNIESSFISALGRRSTNFIDSKHAPSREKFDVDKSYQLENSKILISIMQKIKEEVPQNKEITLTNANVRTLLNEKIQDILDLEKNNMVNTYNLGKIFEKKDCNLFYKHAVTNPDQGRKHSKAVNMEQFEPQENSTENFQDLKKRYQDMRGDALKTSILTEFKREISGAKDKESLDKIVKNWKDSVRYKVLATGQDRTTRLLGLKTSSVKAFEEIVKEAEDKLSPSSSVRPT